MQLVVPIALRTSTILGGAELTAELFAESVRWPALAVAPNDSFGAFEGVALGGIVTHADDHLLVERADHRGPGGLECIAHNRSEVVCVKVGGHHMALCSSAPERALC